MTEQEYWNNAMNEIRLNNRTLLHKSEGSAFVPVYDESEKPTEFVFVQHQGKKVMSVF